MPRQPSPRLYFVSPSDRLIWRVFKYYFEVQRGRGSQMFQTQEQVVEVVKEEETEIVELSTTDLQWIGGGASNVDLGY